MTDVYVYYFMRLGPAGEMSLSKRRATLETIKGRGEAVMESQIVVDQTEVDGLGFLIGGADREPCVTDVPWGEIRSLERRAASRDREALTLNEGSEGDLIYSLRLESRELRNQAQRMKKRRADSMAGESDDRAARVYMQFGGGATTG